MRTWNVYEIAFDFEEYDQLVQSNVPENKLFTALDCRDTEYGQPYAESNDGGYATISNVTGLLEINYNLENSHS